MTSLIAAVAVDFNVSPRNKNKCGFVYAHGRKFSEVVTLLFCYPPEADTAEAQFIADSNEVIGLQAGDDVTTQAPLSTVEPIGERVCSYTKKKKKKLRHFFVKSLLCTPIWMLLKALFIKVDLA